MADRLPKDVDPASMFRLPLPERDALDEAGQKLYDHAARPGETLAGLRGPLGICLHSPSCGRLFSDMNHYLRYKSGLDARVREVTILSVAREMNSDFEWAAHENVALAAGVAPELVEHIRMRGSLPSHDEPYATVVDLVRQVFHTHKVETETFARARSHFTDKHLVELAFLVGAYASTAILLSVFDMQLPPDMKRPLTDSVTPMSHTPR